MNHVDFKFTVTVRAQDTTFFLSDEKLWNFLAVPLFLGLGIKTLMVWDEAKKSDDFRKTEDYATTYSAGIALGALSICIAIVYFCDFILSYRTKSRMQRMDRERNNYRY